MELYGLLCTGLGITPRMVGNMTLPEVARIFDYWARQPPMHILYAAKHGMVRDRVRTNPIKNDIAAADAFAAALGVNLKAAFAKKKAAREAGVQTPVTQVTNTTIGKE